MEWLERLCVCVRVGPPPADKSDWHILKFIPWKFIFSLHICDSWWYVDVIALSLPRLFMQSMYHFHRLRRMQFYIHRNFHPKLYWIKYAETKCHNFKCDYLSSASGPIHRHIIFMSMHSASRKLREQGMYGIVSTFNGAQLNGGPKSFRNRWSNFNNILCILNYSHWHMIRVDWKWENWNWIYGFGVAPIRPNKWNDIFVW